MQDRTCKMKQIKFGNRKKNGLYPVYIVTTYSDSKPSEVIVTHTNSLFSHALLTTDSSLRTMYSFGIETVNGEIRNGLVIDSINNHKEKDSIIQVLCIFVTKDKYNKILNTINDFKAHKNETRYDYKGFLRFATNTSPC